MICNDLYCMDTTTFKWKKLFCLEGPYNRVGSAFTHGFDTRFIIGGASVPENLILNDIWYLDFSEVDWEFNYDLPGAKWN